jgi:hypothetical protein
MTRTEGSRLHGTTWDVYLYILTAQEPVGVRDVWRQLKLSSPSLAQYHINKLVEGDFIKTTLYGKYEVNDALQLEALKTFVLFKGRLIPHLVVYGAIIAGLFLSYLVIYPLRWDFRDLTVIAVCTISLLAFLFEAYNQYRSLAITGTLDARRGSSRTDASSELERK